MLDRVIVHKEELLTPALSMCSQFPICFIHFIYIVLHNLACQLYRRKVVQTLNTYNDYKRKKKFYAIYKQTVRKSEQVNEKNKNHAEKMRREERRANSQLHQL